VTPDWETVNATSVRLGDRIRAHGLELTVTRIDSPFMGSEDFLAFVEDSDGQWLKLPVPIEATLERRARPGRR
jgi:hypothetical protein